jgi:hypothetical protein
MFSNFFFFENRAVYEIMSKNMVELERPQTIWRLRVAYWVSKDTRAQAHALAGSPTHRKTNTNARTYMSSLSPTHTHTQMELCNTYRFSMATAVS